MKTKTTFLVIGLVLGIGLTLGMGTISGQNNGRYAVSAWDNRIFIIDTATGKVWLRSPRQVFLETQDNPGPGILP